MIETEEDELLGHGELVIVEGSGCTGRVCVFWVRGWTKKEAENEIRTS